MLNLKLNKDAEISLQHNEDDNYVFILGGLNIKLDKKQLEEIKDCIILAKGYGENAPLITRNPTKLG